MVIGKERGNWYDDHPAACTCAACEKSRAEQRKFDELTQGRKVGRNELCPCGSGKKFKNCHMNKTNRSGNKPQQRANAARAETK